MLIIYCRRLYIDLLIFYDRILPRYAIRERSRSLINMERITYAVLMAFYLFHVMLTKSCPTHMYPMETSSGGESVRE